MAEKALNIKSPRLLSACYFMCLGIVANLFIQSILYAMGGQKLVPFFPGLILATICSLLVGALFGKAIINTKAPYHFKTFFYGIAIVLVAIPLYGLGLLCLIDPYYPDIIPLAQGLKGHLIIYAMILVYSFLSVGLLLCIACGFASIYLRHRLVYFIERAHKKDTPPQPSS